MPHRCPCAQPRGGRMMGSTSLPVLLAVSEPAGTSHIQRSLRRCTSAVCYLARPSMWSADTFSSIDASVASASSLGRSAARATPHYTSYTL